MSDYTPTTEQVKDLCALGAIHADPNYADVPETMVMIDRWLAEHDAALLEEAANALSGRIGIQSTNGIGWIPADSLAGAARYLRHLARGPRA